MKKINLIIAAGLLSFGILLVGCKKDETPTTQVTTTIKGAVFANTYLPSVAPERAPALTVINAYTDPNALYSITDSSEFYKDDIRFTTTVSSTGDYEIKVSAKNSGTVITIAPDDFVFDQVQTDTTTVRTKFYATPISVTIKGGSTVFQDINYLY